MSLFDLARDLIGGVTYRRRTSDILSDTASDVAAGAIGGLASAGISAYINKKQTEKIMEQQQEMMRQQMEQQQAYQQQMQAAMMAAANPNQQPGSFFAATQPVQQAATQAAPPPPPGDFCYYALIEGKQEGPYDRVQFKRLLDYQLANANTLVWCNGMDKWAPASTVEDMRDLFSGSVPPPPPMG